MFRPLHLYTIQYAFYPSWCFFLSIYTLYNTHFIPADVSSSPSIHYKILILYKLMFRPIHLYTKQYAFYTSWCFVLSIYTQYKTHFILADVSSYLSIHYTIRILYKLMFRPIYLYTIQYAFYTSWCFFLSIYTLQYAFYTSWCFVLSIYTLYNTHLYKLMFRPIHLYTIQNAFYTSWCFVLSIYTLQYAFYTSWCFVLSIYTLYNTHFIQADVSSYPSIHNTKRILY